MVKRDRVPSALSVIDLLVVVGVVAGRRHQRERRSRVGATGQRVDPVHQRGGAAYGQCLVRAVRGVGFPPGRGSRPAADPAAGRALFRMGGYAEARELLRRTRATQVRLFGADDPDTLDSAQGLQPVLNNLGRREEALVLLRVTVAGRGAVLKPAHPLTPRSRAGLLTLLTGAEIAAEEATLLALPADCARYLGLRHPVTVSARHNHARALFVLGRFASADEEIREVAEEYERSFGPDHPTVLAARQLYAQTRAALGDGGTATDLTAAVVARREQGLGPDHPFTLSGRALLTELRTGRRRPPSAPGGA
ncbi:tetratricopeptide repeat protein [Actinacidiphila sp. ITFR-21]|uniref:tetratricopeptide repeat protein n=1 Tax=Actinacidiphila sp. ITFR-21 TaxID=3075199 RepID=UPI00288ADCE4|nr:tetratricopeptide repeat protein [Streptomyces sp. ITFR-21]WNI16279.1 tetratricopeptide repeat protein [Streptomyces sp. ITFR-21]